MGIKGYRDYYEVLNTVGMRYKRMMEGNEFEGAENQALADFIEEFLCAVSNRYPLMKLNRWLGYIQGRLIADGMTTVEAERDWTRPYFRPFDFPETT